MIDPVAALNAATADLQWIINDLRDDAYAGIGDAERLGDAARALHDARLDAALLVADRSSRFPGHADADELASITFDAAFDLADEIRARVTR